MAPDTRSLIQHLLERAPADRLAEEVLALIGLYTEEAPAEIADAITGHLAARLEASPLVAMAERLASAASPLARLCAAKLFVQLDELPRADELLSATLQATATAEPSVLLQRARLRANEGRTAEALADLQQALAQHPPFPWFIKSEKLLKRLLASGVWRPRRQARLALLGSSTTALLAPVLWATGFARGLELEIYEGPFGTFRQEIWEPASGLYRFQPDLVVLLVNQHDLELPPRDRDGRARQFAEELRELWAALRRHSAAHVIQLGLDVPLPEAWGTLEDTLPDGRRRAIQEGNLLLSQELPAGVSYLDPNALVAELGCGYWSAAEWCSTRQYPASAALPRLAEALTSQAAAALGLSAKVLVTDLDNTLWGGVIGEDLLGGIRLGPPTAEGEGYLVLQRYLKELQQRGVLLAVCSKNDRVEAERPFREHAAMQLGLGDFAAFVANWNDKASNLEAIARELSLGLDSFVFLDDNPMERALVRSRLPQVQVPECGATPWTMLATLRAGRQFENLRLTDEDLARQASYQANRARQALAGETVSLDAFLASLEMVAAHGPVDAATLPRVAQLVNKTNQFNLTTRRYSEEQLAVLARSPDWWCHWFRLADRFGDHGLVGVLLAQCQGSRWTIDTWLLSCRVLGRQMEHYMAACLLTAAEQAGATEVVGQYLPTEKNGLVQDLYARLGWTACPKVPGQYLFDLRRQSPPVASAIRERAAEETLRRAA